MMRGSGLLCLGLALALCAALFGRAMADSTPVLTVPLKEAIPAEEPPPAGERSPEEIETEVDQHVQRATSAFTSGRYVVSAQEFQAAYALDQQPIFLFNRAQSLRRGQQLREALSGYRRFLATDPKSSMRAEAQGYINELVVVLQKQDELERERRRPLWRKGWFWATLASGVAAAGLGLGLGLGLGTRDDTVLLDKRLP